MSYEVIEVTHLRINGVRLCTRGLDCEPGSYEERFIDTDYYTQADCEECLREAIRRLIEESWT